MVRFFAKVLIFDNKLLFCCFGAYDARFGSKLARFDPDWLQTCSRFAPDCAHFETTHFGSASIPWRSSAYIFNWFSKANFLHWFPKTIFLHWFPKKSPFGELCRAAAREGGSKKNVFLILVKFPKSDFFYWFPKVVYTNILH